MASFLEFNLVKPLLRQDGEEEVPEELEDAFAAAYSKYFFASLIFGPAASAAWIFFLSEKETAAYWGSAFDGHWYSWWPVVIASFQLRRSKSNLSYYMWEAAVDGSLAGPWVENWYAMTSAIQTAKSMEKETDVKFLISFAAFAFYTLVQMKWQIGMFEEFKDVIGFDYEAEGKRLPFTVEELAEDAAEEAEEDAAGEEEEMW